MGSKISCMGDCMNCMGDCQGNKNVDREKRYGPTRWQDADDTSPEKSSVFRTKDMEISLELLEIENQIDELVGKNNPTAENTRELKRLIEFKELKTKELNNSNASSQCLWK